MPDSKALRLHLLVAAVIVVGFMGLSAGNPSVSAVGPQLPESTATESMEWELLALINKERTAGGLQPLKMQPNLRDYARFHAAEMRDQGRLWHDLDAYVLWLPAGYRSYGENVAMNNSVTGTHTAFMHSPGHRANIMSASYNYIGIGITTVNGSTLYASQNFMANSLPVATVSPPVAPSVIAGDVNRDGRVNALDLSALLVNDGRPYEPADLNSDGTVGAADMAILLAKWTW